MIGITDIFPQLRESLGDYKVHLAQTNIHGEKPLDKLKENTFEEWYCRQDIFELNLLERHNKDIHWIKLRF